MATATVQGVGSGLDIASIVSGLTAADRAPEDQQIQRATSDTNLKLSALGQLSGAFGSLQTSLTNLTGSSSVFGNRKASSDTSTVFTASASANSQTGSYSVKVQTLASAQKLASAPLASATGLGAGTLHIAVGSTSFDVSISAGQDTPAQIMSAINSAASTAGAKLGVSMVNGDSGSTLLFTSGATGTANSITITRSSGSSGLDALVYNPGTLTSLSVSNPATDAQVIIDGVTRTSSSNTLQDTIPGITLNLVSADPGNAHTLTVTPDNTAATNALNNFVSTYNNVVSTMAQLTVYGGVGGQSGPLIGDAMVRSASGQLRGKIGAAIGTLARLGLNTTVDGKLTLDTTKLGTALTANPSSVQSTIQTLGKSLQDVVTQYTGTTGTFSSRSTTLNTKLRKLSQQSADLDARMVKVKAAYTAQYSAMDTLVGQLNSTSAFLTQWVNSMTGTTTTK